MADVFNNIWVTICEWYQSYSSLIHSVFPSQLGDLVEGILDIVVVCLLIKIIASVAFGTKNNG